MLDERLRHAADEAHRVAGMFERPRIEQRRVWMFSHRLVRALTAVAAVAALIGVGRIIAETRQTDGPTVFTQPAVQINADPQVVQASRAIPPNLDVPGSAIEVPLQPITEFLPGDASYIRSFIPNPDEIVAIGQVGPGVHRVFLVTGPSAPDGSQVACIIETSGRSGSCVREQDSAPPFGVAAGWGTDTGQEFRVVMGMVPESTSVVIVTTPRGTFWQVPRGSISFFVLQVSPDQTLEWQLLNATGDVLDNGGYRQ
ncbi:MAG: hypothetical protein GXP34_01210 [Actinobacteria bacterium]|nr:hypothetical protein [Actinomycetota bacterium]